MRDVTSSLNSAAAASDESAKTTAVCDSVGGMTQLARSNIATIAEAVCAVPMRINRLARDQSGHGSLVGKVLPAPESGLA